MTEEQKLQWYLIKPIFFAAIGEEKNISEYKFQDMSEIVNFVIKAINRLKYDRGVLFAANRKQQRELGKISQLNMIDSLKARGLQLSEKKYYETGE